MSEQITFNPLLQFDRLPDFPAIKAEHIQAAVDVVLQENRKRLEQILETAANTAAPDWSSLMEPLDNLDDNLNKVWSTASHLNSVCNTAEIREAYNQAQSKITEYYAELGQNEQLYQCVLALQSRADVLGLDSSQRKILDDSLLDFRLAGVSLPPEQKALYTEMQTKLGQLSNQFGNNVLDATRAWNLHISDKSRLAGVPELSLAAMADAARKKALDGYLITLDFPIYFAVITYADDRSLRETVYRAYATRATSDTSPEYNNYQVIRDILKLRQDMARLLGFENYAAMSIARKMAKSVEQVNHFLDDLIQHSRPAAEQEYAQLAQFARENCGLPDLQAWDVPYVSEKLRKANYDLSQEELRAWFPVEKVKQGLFDIVQRLYGITLEKDSSAGVWHPDVEFYNIRREGELIARFYLDLFTREGKRGGAWMADCRSRRQLNVHGHAVQQQIPVAYLVCNFAPASGDAAALLTHNDVTTLFHEFGHGLHHMLTRENYLRSSGISGVAWDAVELPSQLMENWCWDPESISMISGHYQTGETLPDELLKKMLAARNFQSGMRSVRQLEFALFDFMLHQTPFAEDSDFVSEVLQRARQKAAVYEVPSYNRFQNSFSHIFAGGYAAGYYSYKWAEVLSADVFSRFSSAGVFDREVGTEFLDKILSRGGGADALSMFVDFMGREPDISALLKQDGLLPSQKYQRL